MQNTDGKKANLRRTFIPQLVEQFHYTNVQRILDVELDQKVILVMDHGNVSRETLGGDAALRAVIRLLETNSLIVVRCYLESVRCEWQRCRQQRGKR